MVVVSMFTAPSTGVLHHEGNCTLTVGETDAGAGDLYVTESAVVWAGQGSQCITLDYPHIALHAVQRVPIPLIYMMLDYKLRLPGQPEPADTEEDDDFDPDEQITTELRFMPQNESSLPLIYEAMNKGQALHPDPVDEEGGMLGGDLDDDFMLADTGEAGSQDAAARMEELSIGHSNGNGDNAEGGDDDDDQFADA